MNSETVVIVFLVLTTALVPFSGELAVYWRRRKQEIQRQKDFEAAVSKAFWERRES